MAVPITDINGLSLTLKVNDWARIVAMTVANNENENIKVVRKIRNAVQAVPGVTMTTDVLVTNLKGTLVLGWYAVLNAIPAGEKAFVGNAVYNAIKAIADADFQIYIAQVDAYHDQNDTEKKRIGKNIIFDND